VTSILPAGARGAALTAAVVLAACSRPSGGVAPSTTPPARADASTAIRFVEDDYPGALAEARARGVPLFIDAWASWCHSCLSMRSFVFPDPALSVVADRYVWLSLDTEREGNAALVTRLGVAVLPTLYVIDARDERVSLAWPGSLTARELATLLGDASGDAGPHGPLAVDALVTGASRDGRWSDCATTAAREAPVMPRGTALADVLRTGIECAEKAPDGTPARDTLGALAELGERTAKDGEEPILADDRSDLYDYVRGAYVQAGRADDASRVARAWSTFVDDQAAHATTPSARAVFDAHRLLAYQALGQPERAVPMLEQSERDFPDDYNPPARLASALLSMKRYADALSAVNRALGRAYGPRKLRLWSLEADVYVASGDVPGARKALTEGVAFARSVPLVERYPAQLDAMSKRLADLQGAPADAGRPSPPRKGLGASCSGSANECAPGLACCETGFHGHCGGVAPAPGEPLLPCVTSSTCAPAPCQPLTFPP
jgi:tetratricopeptide (TPR) repeat protein